MNDSITVSDMGFRGGLLYNETSCFNSGIGGALTYRCPTGGNCGATKGEGATNLPFALGRGANANGGGGGNDHNTGGGGGGNFGKGGKGGQRLNVSNSSCPGPAPGEGGIPFSYSGVTKRLFMGGGGGAGDQNNNEGTAGKDGAGIIILNVKQLIANGKRICANGSSVPIKAQSDGAGAGGAGGSILINATLINGALNIEAKGGKGGNLDNGGSMTFCFGPGGGGAGGALLVNNPTLLGNINFVATGGLSGAQVFQETLGSIALLLFPVVPHIGQALYAELKPGADAGLTDFPKADPAALKQDEIELVVQVNGKLRGSVRVPAAADKAAIEAAALACADARKFTDGKPPKKVVVVPGRLVNIVV